MFLLTKDSLTKDKVFVISYSIKGMGPFSPVGKNFFIEHTTAIYCADSSREPLGIRSRDLWFRLDENSYIMQVPKENFKW